jgi:hypothetical protein
MILFGSLDKLSYRALSISFADGDWPAIWIFPMKFGTSHSPFIQTQLS